MLSAHTDLPLRHDPSTRLLPWIIGFMVYLATLAVAGGLVLQDFAQTWNEGLTGSLTVQVPPLVDDSAEETRARVEAVRDVLRRVKGIERAELLTGTEIAGLLAPWLGSGLDPADLPLPQLFTVSLGEAGSLDMDDLSRQLTAAAPGTTVDDHGLWRRQLLGVIEALQLVAAVIILVVACAGVLMVVFATRGGLATHRQTIELLHLIGARDAYIARQFQIHALRASLKGGLAGFSGSVITLLGIGYLAGTVWGGEAHGLLGLLDWISLLAVPLVLALFSMATAFVTVMRVLSRVV